MDSSAITRDTCTIFRDLHEKFGRNLELSLNSAESLKKVELKARSFIRIGELFPTLYELSATQLEISQIFRELFADSICALYFAACALDRPAQMALRRVLELGIAVVYLWDLPHAFYAWKDHEVDLNFGDMLAHLESSGYRSYVAHSLAIAEIRLVDIHRANTLYGNLSDTVHGKLKTFETPLDTAFNHSGADWEESTQVASEVCDVLLSLWRARFPRLAEALVEKMPQLHAL
jgi:hypothetical protein